MTNGGYSGSTAHGKVFALDVEGNVLAEYDVGGPRYWGEAFVTNVDDDPYMELVVGGSGGYDVIQTQGYGPNTEYFQRRQSYSRLNVVPWAYEDDYFIYRGLKINVENETDDLVLVKRPDGDYAPQGVFVTELLTLPTDEFRFTTLLYETETPADTSVTVNVLDDAGKVVLSDVANGTELELAHAVKLQFILGTTDGSVTPHLNFYSLAFDKIPPLEGDLDGDGLVGSSDLDLVRANWGNDVTPGDLSAGDPSGDGTVGSADLDIIRGNWGASRPTPVPEPGQGTVLFWFILAGQVRHRRKRHAL